MLVHITMSVVSEQLQAMNFFPLGVVTWFGVSVFNGVFF